MGNPNIIDSRRFDKDGNYISSEPVENQEPLQEKKELGDKAEQVVNILRELNQLKGQVNAAIDHVRLLFDSLSEEERGRVLEMIGGSPEDEKKQSGIGFIPQSRSNKAEPLSSIGFNPLDNKNE
jgi:hypothetical protein